MPDSEFSHTDELPMQIGLVYDPTMYALCILELWIQGLRAQCVLCLEVLDPGTHQSGAAG